MSSFCDWLISEGETIHFIPNETRMDNWVIDDIISKMNFINNEASNIKRPETNTYIDVYNNLASCDYVIASRFHGLLFSFLSTRPVITIAFHFKFFALAKSFGQEKYSVDIESFQLDQLKNLFINLKKDQAKIKEIIADKSSHYPMLVEEQFKKMNKLIYD